VSAESASAKVRALLAQAAGTTYQAERDAFMAKAQELMTRYQLTEAELGDTPDRRLSSVTISLEGWGNATAGYSVLVQGVARLNRCDGYRQTDYRNGGRQVSVVLFGTSPDLDMVRALVEYLGVQLRADIARDRPRSRKSYAIGWQHLVVARLKAAQVAEATACRLPVPTSDAATRHMTEATPGLRSSSERPTSWDDTRAGRQRGALADIGGQRLAGSRQAIAGGAGR
jgi:hypothetical protein